MDLKYYSYKSNRRAQSNPTANSLRRELSRGYHSSDFASKNTQKRSQESEKNAEREESKASEAEEVFNIDLNKVKDISLSSEDRASSRVSQPQKDRLQRDQDDLRGNLSEETVFKIQISLADNRSNENGG